MFEQLKRLFESGAPDEEPGFILGYAILFENDALGVHFEGLPSEVADEVQAAGLELSFLANHVETGISVRRSLPGAARSPVSRESARGGRPRAHGCVRRREHGDGS